jgi:outer membrane protein, multidrug efflux system
VQQPLWTLLIAWALLTAGCAKVGPDYHAPVPAVPDQFPNRQGLADEEVELTRWWASFHDAELDALVAKSLSANHQRRLALARLAEARALLGIAHARRGPTLGVAGSADYLGAHIREIMPLKIDPTEFYEVGLDSSWEVDIWGAVRREKEGALADVEAAQLGVLDVANTVAAEVTRAWLQLAFLQSLQHLAEERVGVIAAQRDVFERRRASGFATDADVAGARAAVAAAETILPPLVAAQEQTLHGLCLLTGGTPGQDGAGLAPARSLPALPGELAVGVPAGLLRRRPDLRRAERQLAAATARVGVARADLYPRLALNGLFAAFSTEPRDLVARSSTLWMVGPSFRWKLLDWGRVRSLIKVADARVEQALVAYEGTLLIAQQEVADALSGLEQERLRADMAQRCWNESRRNEQATAELRRRGLADELTLLIRRQATLEADLLRLNIQYARLLNIVALAKALGGGWEPDAALAPAAASLPVIISLRKEAAAHD